MKFKKTQGFQTMGKRTLFTSMAAVALLGATTTAVTATMNVNQVNAAATTKSDTIVVDYNLPIVKDGVETTVKVSIVVENINEWRLFAISVPKIDGYTPNMQEVLLSRSPEGRIVFESNPLIYTKTGNPTNPGDGSSSESNNSNSSSNNESSNQESSDSNNSSNHESNSESSNQESNGTSSSSNDESSNNGSSNGASNNESSNSSSSVNNGSNNGTSNNTDSNGAGETSHSAAGTVNTTNNGQNGSANSADKATNTADKTGNKPTTLLQTG
ncbi:hypothetical protein [Latilactobacillus sakei]|uniref:hypothetical protein n=1 Tax=Latilactobacillus sakei TaxID=1599 RepID=UPI000DC64A77|nr:hypothetical protein [Latilactobacillus sakei]SPS03212.1 hypothetical protein LAS9624_00015 [Latilactobacillus sakei]